MSSAGKAPKAIVAVGDGVVGLDRLLAGFGIGTTIVPVPYDACPIRTISLALEAHGPVDRLVLVAHGRPGAVALGTGLDASVLLDRSGALRGWRDHWNRGATIQMLACSAGAGESGRKLVNLLANISGAALAAASHPLGHTSLGGVWQLDVVVGAADAHPPLDPTTQAEWVGVLSWTSGPDAGDNVYNGDGANNVGLNGLAGNDTLNGNGGHDQLSGGDDQDWIFGNDGDDSLVGEAGHDQLFGGSDQDSLVGGDGNDTLAGELGSDTLFGGNDADSLNGGEQNDTLDGGTGEDTILGGGDADSILGGAQRDTLSGGDGNDSIYGGDDADSIVGDNGDDYLIGETGNDTIFGGADQDSLEGGVGDDRLFGELGNDRLSGSDDQDSLVGADGSDTLVGDNGNDTLRGGTGADSLMGSGGFDQAEVAPGEIAVGDSFDGGADSDTLFILGSSVIDISLMTLTSVERLLASGSGGNRITITGAQFAGFATIEGGTGADSLQSADSMDFTGKTLIGFDYFSVGGGQSIVLPAGYTTKTTLVGSTGNETFIGSDGADLLLANNGNDSLVGGAGADTIDGENGSDTQTGGPGADVFRSFFFNLNSDRITDFSVGDSILIPTHTISGIQNGGFSSLVAFGIHRAEIAGDTYLYMDSGNGGDSEVTMILTGIIPLNELQVTGNKIERVSVVPISAVITNPSLALAGPTTALSTVTLNASGEATVTLNGSAAAPTGGANSGITQVTAAALTGTGAVEITGNAADNSLTGSANADTLNGASGNDSLVGGGGADSLIGGLGIDTVSGGDGDDTVVVLPGDTGPSESYSGDAGTDTLSLASGSQSLHQSTVAGFEMLVGSAGSDYVTLTSAQLSQFTLTVNLGGASDVLHLEEVSANIDLTAFPLVGVEHVRLNPTAAVVVTDSPNFSVDISLSNTFAHTIVGSMDGDFIGGGYGGESLLGGGGDDTLAGDNGADKLEGGAGVDLLFGGAGPDTLVGGGQADTVVGDGGNDTIELGSGGGVVFGGADNDTVVAGSGTTGAVIVGDTVLTDAFGDLLNGTAGADTIFGCGGADVLSGHDANDILLGGDGSDTLSGGAGNDTLWGDSGNDRFEFAYDSVGTDVIVDFIVGPERLAFGFGSFASVQQTVLGNGLQLVLGSVTVQLIGVTAPLAETDLIFFTPV